MPQAPGALGCRARGGGHPPPSTKPLRLPGPGEKGLYFRGVYTPGVVYEVLVGQMSSAMPSTVLGWSPGTDPSFQVEQILLPSA